MESRDLAIILFNQKMDTLIENVLTSKSGTPELNAEYVKFANICRRIGVYDVNLAWEVFYSGMTLGYAFGRLVLEEKSRCRGNKSGEREIRPKLRRGVVQCY